MQPLSQQDVALHHAATTEIREDSQQKGRMALISGLIATFVTAVAGTFYLVYSSSIPEMRSEEGVYVPATNLISSTTLVTTTLFSTTTVEGYVPTSSSALLLLPSTTSSWGTTVGFVLAPVGPGCESNMKLTFQAMGVMNILMAVVYLAIAFATKIMFTAMAHKALVDKWATDPEHANDVEQEKAEFDHDIKQSGAVGAGACCCLCVLLPCMMGFSIYGIIQASNGTDENCGGSVKIYWMLLILSCLSSACQQMGNKDNHSGGSEDGGGGGGRPFE